MNKAIYIEGHPGSGKTLAAGTLLDSIWELNIARRIEEPEIAEKIESAIRGEKKYLHIDGLSKCEDIALPLKSALDQNICVIITSIQSPPESIREMVIWLKAQPFPYK